MLFKSTLLAQTSGSVDGLTFAHNRGGRYVRRRAIPVNPSTPLQVSRRTAMADLVVSWQALTAEQRTAWDTYAANVPTTNRLGESINLTGQQWYIACNSLRKVAGLALVDDGPTDFSLTSLGEVSFTAEESTQTITLTYPAGDEWAGAVGGALLAFCSREVAPTINFFKGPFKYAGKVAGAVVPPASPGTYTNPFGIDFTLGTRVFLRVIAIAPDGRISAPQIVRAEVTS